MRDLYIVGAGGFGREVYAWLSDLPLADRNWKLAGFLDDNADALEGFDYPHEVVGPVSGFAPKQADLFVCGIGTIAGKKAACAPLFNQGAEFLTLVHPSVVMGQNVVLGRGVVICPGAVLTCDIKVGDFAMINCLSSLGHDVSLGSWSTVSAHCDLTGFVQVGEGVFMGSGARVIPGKSVGSDAIIGAGAVVIRAVKPGQKVFGNPARIFA